ncbi:type II toxin-antitoxin system Phd/YefM family antitoxin [Kitasatospora azatica]|uniref:type II toxin-antitoxin system Phd/YefM family antitoxin n=1 Tax=Kitasatospora azatica TaxID=58347 RepID=UPI0005677304|nr:type II toxin-antitoxin system Phd/YefM family antitoxin [Kitasatospora azatica]
METIPITEAKGRIAELADRAEREHDEFTLTRNGRPSVVIMSVAQYESMMETMAVLADPDLVRDIKEAKENPDEHTTGDEMAQLMAARLGKKTNAA